MRGTAPSGTGRGGLHLRREREKRKDSKLRAYVGWVDGGVRGYLIRSVGVGSAVQQQPHHLEVAVLGGHVESSGAFLQWFRT